MKPVAMMALAALALAVTQARALDFTPIRIEVATARHGGFVEATAAVTNESASRIDVLKIACTIMSGEHRPLDIQDGYLTDIGSGATAYAKLLFLVPPVATLGGVACRAVDMQPRITLDRGPPRRDLAG